MESLFEQSWASQNSGSLSEIWTISVSLLQKTITEPTSFTKTGARHSFAKYLLFPVKLRRQFKTDEFDFEKLQCGTVLYKDKLYVVYGVSKKFGIKNANNKEEILL